MLTCSRSRQVGIRSEEIQVEHPNQVSKPKYFFIFPEYSEFYEEYTPNSIRGRRWKSFEHYKRGVNRPSDGGYKVKVSCDNLGGNPYYHRYLVGSSDPYAFATCVYGAPGLPLSGLQAWYVKREDGGFVPPPAGLDDLLSLALRSMMPGIKSEMSVLNSIYELKDMRSLLSSLRSLQNVPSQLRSLLSGDRFRGRTLREILRSVAGDAYLQYSFNLAPLVSDIASILEAMRKYEARLRYLINNEGRTRVKHWSTSLREYADPIPAPQSMNIGSYQALAWNPNISLTHTDVGTRFVNTDETQFHVQVKFNYSLTDFQREHARVLGFLDSIGVNCNPAIIWNALPWTFVLDWVVGVSQWLSSFTIGNMQPQINIQECLWSVKRSRSIVVQHHTLYNAHYAIEPDYVTGPEVQLPAFYESAYRRQVFTPSMSSLAVSGLSSKEVSLGAALVLARRPRHRRYRLNTR